MLVAVRERKLQTQHVLLLRHGETDANRNGITQGHSPTLLNELGRHQARLLARRLATYVPRVEVLVSSDLPRAQQTAEPIAAALGLPVQADAAWRERCYGIMEGKSRAEREQLRRELGMPDGPPPGAQTTDEYHRQILDALHALPRQHATARCIAVVTHAGAVRAVTMALSEVGEEVKAESYKPCPNCSITQLACTRRDGEIAFELVAVHDVGHLDLAETTSRDSG